MRLILLLFALATVAPAQAQSDWAVTAADHRGSDGPWTYECPPGGEAHTVWGSDPYTDDSSVCTAAVHAGRITLADGGTVTIRMTGAAEAFPASEQNGITTSRYGAWGGSFEFVTEPEMIPEPLASSAQTVNWDTDMTPYRGENGTTFALFCPAGGAESWIWGDGIYTDDSSVCTAGVHAGAITFARGGELTVEILPGQGAYTASERNGVQSRSFPEWEGSFRIVQ